MTYPLVMMAVAGIVMASPDGPRFHASHEAPDGSSPSVSIAFAEDE